MLRGAADFNSKKRKKAVDNAIRVKYLFGEMNYRKVARDFGIRETLIHNWRKAFEVDGTLKFEVKQSLSVEAKLRRLREENR